MNCTNYTQIGRYIHSCTLTQEHLLFYSKHLKKTQELLRLTMKKG